VKAVAVRYFGETVNLPDLSQYRKFYRKLESGNWEPHTFRVLGEYLNRQTTYIDVGGWIGVTPFWASRRAKQVIVIEPDPQCRAILRDLSSSYPNVILFDAALSPSPSVRINAIDGFGSSETTALDLASGDSLEVPGISVETIMRDISREQIFVKIDIEGYEYRILPEIARFADYQLRGLQCALHPALYERSLRGKLPARRMRTLLTTAKIAWLRRDLSAAPLGAKYTSIFSYLLFGVLFRAVPRGTDLILTPQAGS